MGVKTRWRDTCFVVGLTWVGTAIATLWLVMSFTYPFGWDQGLFAWVGDVIVDGGLPYRDGWDIKGPLLYYVYAFAQWLFGVHLWSIRVVDAALLAVAAWVVFRTASELTDEKFARFAAVFFILWYASHSYWHTAQPDGWAGMLVLVAVGPSLAGSASPGVPTMVRAGVCVGLATLLKPVWIAFIALPILHVAMRRQPGRGWLLLAVLSGCALPVGLAIGWFAWQGALADLVDVHLKYAALYAGLAPDHRLKSLAEYFLSGRVMTVSLPVAAYGAVVLWRDRRPAAILLLAWLTMALFLVGLQGRFYAYHWLPLLPAVTLLVAVGLHDLSLRTRTFAHIACLILLMTCAAPVSLEAVRFLGWRVGAIDRQRYYDAYGEPGNDMRAVEWLRTIGAPGRIFTFGWLCSVAWLSERESVSRFGYSLPLMMGKETETLLRYRAEVIAALSADPPRYIVVGALSEQILGTRLTIADFPELNAWVHSRYREVARFGTIAIHEIKP